VLFELTEFALYSIEQELNNFKKEQGLTFPIYPFMGSVQHKNRLKEVMRLHKVQTVYHAAAYKHVPLVELNIIEGIRNNVFGTWFTAEAAIEANVETFVLVSTDKAVRPTNFMGASKRLAELVLQAKSRMDNQSVRFCMVRFGNVLGSSGSVVPLFRKQIRAGGPVTLTHPDITRFFMTIPEASQLVIQAGSMGKGGDVFVLDMGESVKIMDLATRMIRLMGLTVHTKEQTGDIEIVHSGLRPGEKLYEELLIGDNVQGTDHSKIMTATEEYLEWPEMASLLKKFDHACHSMDCEKIRELILSAPVGYNPQHEVKDMLWALEPQARSAEVVDLPIRKDS
jgi:FlaA1/EpsC-like NDP-sugar epimerase